MRKVKLLLLSILLICMSQIFAAPQNGTQEEIAISRQNAITRAIERVSPAIAGINVTAIQDYAITPFFDDPFWNLLFPDQIHRQRVKSIGSGVVVSADGYVVTNAHVVEGAVEVVVTLIGGKEYKAKIIGVDEVSDLALLQIEGKQFAFAKMGSSDDVIIGEWVIALGNPFGLFNINYKPTATIGIVSGMNLNFGRQQSGRVYQNMIQTDASINTGNSGGPLVNANGEVIGINTFIFTGGNYSEGSIGIGFAIPVNRVKAVVTDLKKSGNIKRSFKTGLSIQNIDRFLANYLKLPSTSGVIVTQVERGSAGYHTGIKVGDVIIQVNKRKVTCDADILAEIEENYLKAGDKLRLKLLRNKQELEVDLVLE